MQDITFTQHQETQAFHLRIKMSKTDQYHLGVVVVLAATVSDICPIQIVLDYLGRRGNRQALSF